MKSAFLFFNGVQASGAFLILFLTLMSGSSSRAADLLVNGGFEDIPIVGNTATYQSTTTPAGFGWTVIGAVDVYNSGAGYPPLTGTQSLSIADVGAGVSQTVPVTPGFGYTLRWVAGSSVAGVPYRFSVKIQGARLIYLKDYSGTNGTGTLEPETVTFTASETTSAVTVTFKRTLGSATGLALDEISLAEETTTFLDLDRDGFPDHIDRCQGSDLRATIFVGTTNTGVSNLYAGSLVDANGCTLADHIHMALVQAADSSRVSNQPNRVNRNRFNRAMRNYLNGLEDAGLLTSQQRDDIMDAVRAVDGAQFLP